MNFCLQLFFLASLCFSFQVPRKAVFCHHRGNEQPLNPPKQMKLKTHRTHQPVSAPCAPLVCSPWKPLGKGCQPPTTSTTVLWHACLCAHQGELQFVLLTPGVRWVACKKYSHTEKNVGFSSCAFDLISVWGQIRAPGDICSEMPFFFPVVSVRTCSGEFWQFCWQFGKKLKEVKEISKSSLLLMTVELLSSD